VIFSGKISNFVKMNIEYICLCMKFITLSFICKKLLEKHIVSLGLLQKSIRELTLVLSCQSRNDMATSMKLTLMKEESSRTTCSCRAF